MAEVLKCLVQAGTSPKQLGAVAAALARAHAHDVGYEVVRVRARYLRDSACS